MSTQVLHQCKKGNKHRCKHAPWVQKKHRKASNAWFQKPLTKSEDIGDTGVFNIIDNLMAKGGQRCESGWCWFTANKKGTKIFFFMNKTGTLKKKEEMKKRSSFEALIWSGCDWNNHARQVVCVALCIVFARWRHFQSQTKCRNNSTCQLVRRSYCLLIQQKHSPALLSSNFEVLLWRAVKIDDNAQIDNVLNDGWR